MRALVATAAITGTLVGAGAQAQESDTGITVGARAQVRYDSNILRLDDGIEPAPDRSKSDLVFSPLVYVEARVEPGLQGFSLIGEAGKDFHLENDFLDAERVGVEGIWDWAFTSRCSGTANAAYRRGQADLSEQGVLAENVRQSVNLGFEGGCAIGRSVKPVVYLRYRTIENSNVVRFSSDNETLGYGVGVSYRSTRTAGITASVQRRELSFPNRLDPATGLADEVDQTFVNGILDVQLANAIAVTATASHHWIDSRATDTASVFAGGVSAQFRPSPIYSFTLIAQRSIEPPTYVVADFVQNDRLELGGQYRFTQRTALGFRIGRERNDFRNSRGIASDNLRTFDRTDYAVLEGSWTPARALEATLEVRYTDKTTDGGFGTFEGFQSVLQVTAKL